MVYLTLEKSLHSSVLTRLSTSVGSFVVALLLGGCFLYAVEIDALEAYALVWDQIFLDYYGWQDLGVKMIPLLLTGSAVALAAQMKIWNIGAEGQLYLGAIICSWIALNWGEHLSSLQVLPLMFVGALLGGALWASVPAILRAQVGVNEIITTLLLNYVAINIADYLLFGPWREASSFNFPITREFAESTAIPLIGETSVHYGIFFGLVIAGIIYLVLQKTKIGFQIRVIGDNFFAAQYSGFSTRKMIIVVLMISGGIAGLAGMTEIAGIHHRMQQNFSINYGYTGIIVAWLARNHPLAVIPTSLLMALIFVGGELLQIEFQLPIAMIYLFQGIILFSVLSAEIFTQYRVSIVRKRE